MECEICVGEITNPAVCSKRATLLGNVDRANRKAAVRAELTKRLDVKSVSGRGRSSQYHSRILDRWAANTAALKAPRRKTPCRSRALLVDCSTCCHRWWGYRGFMKEISRSNRIKNVVSLQLAREHARQPRGASTRHVSNRNNQRLLERLEAENAQLRGRVVDLLLQLQALRDGAR